jgi:hypothetical protein
VRSHYERCFAVALQNATLAERADEFKHATRVHSARTAFEVLSPQCGLDLLWNALTA